MEVILRPEAIIHFDKPFARTYRTLAYRTVSGNVLRNLDITSRVVATKWWMGVVPESFPADVPYNLHDLANAPLLETLAKRWGVEWPDGNDRDHMLRLLMVKAVDVQKEHYRSIVEAAWNGEPDMYRPVAVVKDEVKVEPSSDDEKAEREYKQHLESCEKEMAEKKKKWKEEMEIIKEEIEAKMESNYGIDVKPEDEDDAKSDSNSDPETEDSEESEYTREDRLFNFELRLLPEILASAAEKAILHLFVTNPVEGGATTDDILAHIGGTLNRTPKQLMAVIHLIQEHCKRVAYLLNCPSMTWPIYFMREERAGDVEKGWRTLTDEQRDILWAIDMAIRTGYLPLDSMAEYMKATCMERRHRSRLYKNLELERPILEKLQLLVNALTSQLEGGPKLGSLGSWMQTAVEQKEEDLYIDYRMPCPYLGRSISDRLAQLLVLTEALEGRSVGSCVPKADDQTDEEQTDEEQKEEEPAKVIGARPKKKSMGKMRKPDEGASAAEWAAWESQRTEARAEAADKKETRVPKKRAKPKQKPADDATEAEHEAWAKECNRLEKRRNRRDT